MRQLDLDPAVARVGCGGVARIEGMVLAEPGRGQALRGNALRGQESHHRQRARGRELPVRRELRSADGPAVGMAVDTQYPVM